MKIKYPGHRADLVGQLVGPVPNEHGEMVMAIIESAEFITIWTKPKDSEGSFLDTAVGHPMTLATLRELTEEEQVNDVSPAARAGFTALRADAIKKERGIDVREMIEHAALPPAFQKPEAGLESMLKGML